MGKKQASQTLKNHRGGAVSPRFLAPKLVRAISQVGCPRSERLALGISQGLMGQLLARSVGRHRVWSRWTVRDWEAQRTDHAMTAEAREAYRRLMMDILDSVGLYLRRTRRGYQAVRGCRRCGRVFAVTTIRQRNCQRCR